MKHKIDDLVRQILVALAEQPKSTSELESFFQLIGADGPSKAVKLRDVLASYADDPLLNQEDRSYASMQLTTLPAF